MTKAKGGSVLDILGEMTAPAATPAAAPAPVVPAAPLLARIDDIEPDPEQPRREFDEADLDDLASSFKMVGILEPLVLRETNGQAPFTKRFVILAGERRWRAAPRAGLEEVPYVLRNDIAAEDVFLAQVVENTNRKDLTDFELAKSIRRVLDSNKKIKQKDIAAAMNKSKATISKVLGMLDDDVIQFVEEGLLRTANDVSFFKALSDDDKLALVEKVRAEGGRPISRPDFDDLKAAKASAAPAADAASGESGHAEGGTSVEDGAGAGSSVDSGSDGGQLEGDGQQAGADVGGEGGFPDFSGATAGDGEAGGFGGEGAGLDGLGGFGGEAGGDGGSDEGGTSVATSSSSGEKGPAGPKPVSVKLKVEDVERLIPHFVDKSEDKVELRFSADLAIALIENLGGTVPDDAGEYGEKIKDLLA
ncbi:ParB/RepB/Spo0J family partition protein [Diaphorobacter sp. MNS-0]|uniref:ParB/RepB/Spo0J family partition protein n=1 Tax=Diaphorobacter sp. MNS-0 TaxID=2866628 RepID=UPI001C7336A9|nr:ParB/RepB/Spo0J family partition protein [Diaphorobacter sp. MNS-0]QYY27479.1 ParB/RepB/Spo0J family partition protein [Diaphorobacter sp. MNS-0]